MRAGLAAILSALLATAAPQAARADLLIAIDKDAQRMDVSVDGQPRYSWPVSTGVAGHDTPSGSFRPFRMERTHFSKEWDDAPMPFSMFFTGQGHAIHGTNHVRNLGHAASHGCVRLSVRNAATLFGLVKAQGMNNTRVAIEGSGLDAGALVAEGGRRARTAARRGGGGDGYGYGYGAASYDDDQTGARTAYYPVRRRAPGTTAAGVAADGIDGYAYGYRPAETDDLGGW